jgi:hypothetical protein
MHKDRTFSDPHIAILAAKHDGLIRLVAIALSIVFWLICSVALLVLYLHDPKVLEPLDKPYQVATALGLSPIGLGVLTWRLFELGCCWFLNRYTKNHVVLE